MRPAVIKRPRRLGFNMTPMIDVVFLLIIFFLVSSHLARQESRVKLALPVAESGDEEPAESARRVTINITEDGAITLAGRPVPLLDIEKRLVMAKQELGKDLEVRIRCSRLTPYREIEPVMLACSRQGIWNVKFAVYRVEQ